MPFVVPPSTAEPPIPTLTPTPAPETVAPFSMVTLLPPSTFTPMVPLVELAEIVVVLSVTVAVPPATSRPVVFPEMAVPASTVTLPAEMYTPVVLFSIVPPLIVAVAEAPSTSTPVPSLSIVAQVMVTVPASTWMPMVEGSVTFTAPMLTVVLDVLTSMPIAPPLIMPPSIAAVPLPVMLMPVPSSAVVMCVVASLRVTLPAETLMPVALPLKFMLDSIVAEPPVTLRPVPVPEMVLSVDRSLPSVTLALASTSTPVLPLLDVAPLIETPSSAASVPCTSTPLSLLGTVMLTRLAVSLLPVIKMPVVLPLSVPPVSDEPVPSSFTPMTLPVAPPTVVPANKAVAPPSISTPMPAPEIEAPEPTVAVPASISTPIVPVVLLAEMAVPLIAVEPATASTPKAPLESEIEPPVSDALLPSTLTPVWLAPTVTVLLLLSVADPPASTSMPNGEPEMLAAVSIVTDPASTFTAVVPPEMLPP